jgi:hypothetical protein
MATRTEHSQAGLSRFVYALEWWGKSTFYCESLPDSHPDAILGSCMVYLRNATHGISLWDVSVSHHHEQLAIFSALLKTSQTQEVYDFLLKFNS